MAPRDPFAALGEATAACMADVMPKSHPCTLYTKRLSRTCSFSPKALLYTLFVTS
jgi:hypothetical protein